MNIYLRVSIKQKKKSSTEPSKDRKEVCSTDLTRVIRKHSVIIMITASYVYVFGHKYGLGPSHSSFQTLA